LSIAPSTCCAALARGEAGPVAFGLHFNPEAPRLDAETIAAILKAFVLLNDWLRRESRPRRLSHFVGFGRAFPPAYVQRVVTADYWPDLADLMGDYLEANPTRRRNLDLLPLFLHLDERRVRARLSAEKIGKRPFIRAREGVAALFRLTNQQRPAPV
jgi:hypothetical protein